MGAMLLRMTALTSHVRDNHAVRRTVVVAEHEEIPFVWLPHTKGAVHQRWFHVAKEGLAIPRYAEAVPNLMAHKDLLLYRRGFYKSPRYADNTSPLLIGANACPRQKSVSFQAKADELGMGLAVSDVKPGECVCRDAPGIKREAGVLIHRSEIGLAGAGRSNQRRQYQGEQQQDFHRIRKDGGLAAPLRGHS